MLNLLLGKDWVSNRERILSMVAGNVHEGLGGRILIVPELISHDTERRLCAAAGDSASRYAEVLSFTRLARRVAEQMGSAAKECLDNGGRVVAMAAAALQLHSKLKAYASVETRPEFLTELVNAVDEFKRCCITAEDLRFASRQTEGSLAQKLEELSLLLETYDGLCLHGKRDPRDQMTWLLEQLAEGDFAQNHVFYIDGFPDFTRQHLAILEYLIQVSPCVTVSMNCDRAESGAMAFEKAGHTVSQLLRCARHAGVKVQTSYVAEAPCPLIPARELLFQGKTRQIPELNGRLLLYRTDTKYQECLGAAQRIWELVRGGSRFRDIGVVCADMDGYRELLSLVFHRSGIPLYQSGTEDILQKGVVSTVLSAMDAALGGFAQRDILRYLKSVLSPLDVDDCDRVENYAVLWNVQGSRWQTPWVNHPAGLGKDWSEADTKSLEQLNQARLTALTPLFHLRQGFLDAKNVSDQIRALYAFLEEIRLAERLDALANTLDRQGDHRNAQILNQLWEILLSAMEQLHDVLGGTVWDGGAFTRLFSLLLSQYDVGTIPPVLDAVTAGPVSAMRCQRVSHLIVLGAVEGALPGYGGTTGVLTDSERVVLRELGVPLTGGNLEGLQAEFAEIYGVFCGARESIAVFCPAGQPSYVFRRLSELAGGEKPFVPVLEAVLTDSRDAAGYLAASNDMDSARALGMESEYADICRRRDYTLGQVTSENIFALYGKQITLSASQVDKQAACRLAYFLNYGLKAKERKEATVDPAEFGSYVHSVLEKTVNAVMERGGFHEVPLEQTWELAKGFSDAYAAERFSQIDSKRVAYLLRRNLQELYMIVREIWQELHVSLFQPEVCELGFGDGKTMPPIRVDGRKMDARLIGFVDRVDCWLCGGDRFFRVVDYKTGKKDFDYCDILNGLGLQMLLYLFALEQSGQKVLGDRIRLAGVQYLSARSPVLSAPGRLTDAEAESERGKKWKRKGLLLAEDAVLDAMSPEGDFSRLCCERKKDGSLSGDLADAGQFRMLREYVFRLLGCMVDEIASGEVSPNPYTRGTAYNACSYCPYQAICHAETVMGRRNYKAVKAQSFWETVEREVNHG